jgi:ABC transport system ATP-binding/permease protein
MWKLSIEDDHGATTVVQLARGEYTIGRGEENTIRLTERNISRRHARLVKRDESWLLIDLGSYNGCFVNGVRGGDTQSVGPKDLIQLGDYRLEFITDEDLAVTQGGLRPDTTASIIPSPPYDTNHDRLVMVVGPTPGREYTLSDQQQLVGRGDDCNIAVNHPSVSRHHATIHYLKDHHYELIDKKSSNGLRINGVELERGLIESHDVIEFGDVVLKFIPAGQVYRPTPDEAEKIAMMLGVSDDTNALSHAARLKFAWSGMSRTVRVGVLVLGFLVLAMFVAVVVTGRPLRAHRSLRASSTMANSAANLLQTAQSISAAGSVEAAHELLKRIPESSSLRQDPSFKSLQAKWADLVLLRADNATTPEEQRVTYEALLRDSSLDDAHRSRAQDRLNALNARVAAQQALAVADSGTAAIPEAEARSPAKANSPNVKTGSSGHSMAKSSSASGVAATVGSAGHEMAQILAKKNELKIKVASGNSTDSERRYLRALCRQLNDASCSR